MAIFKIEIITKANVFYIIVFGSKCQDEVDVILEIISKIFNIYTAKTRFLNNTVFKKKKKKKTSFCKCRQNEITTYLILKCMFISYVVHVSADNM